MGISVPRHPLNLKHVALTWLIIAAVTTTGGASLADDELPVRLPSERGAALFNEHCAMCHEHPTGRIPPVFVLNYKSPEQIVLALTQGLMRQQAEELTAEDIKQIAVHLSGREPGATKEVDPSANLCAQSNTHLHTAPGEWNGLNANVFNSRFQPDPGIGVSDVPRLKLKWAFTYPGGAAYGQPTVVGNTLYLGSATGRIFALDSNSGCTRWSWQADGAVRTAISVGIPPSSGDVPAVYFGDEKSAVYSVDARSGKLLWKTQVDDHPLARITGSPVLFDRALYVPVASLSEGTEHYPDHPCCTFQGSVVAVDAASGKIRWKTSMIARRAVPLGRKNEMGAPQFGPSGAAIWAAPTIDPVRHLLYVGTGNAYNAAEEGDTNAIVALDTDTGQRRWATQPRPFGDPYTICRNKKRADCEKPGPEYLEFGDSPILARRTNGQSVLVIGQKSGVVYAVDPDQEGKEVWQTRIGQGGPLGGVMYGGAVDGQAAYFSVADRDASVPFSVGGLSAINLEDGRVLWRKTPPAPVCSWRQGDCSAAQPGATTVIPGVVFSGALDGHLRAMSTTDGKVLWDYDTAAGSYASVNGTPGHGGSINGYPQIIANGSLYLNSGGSLLSHPGNVLLVFSVDGK